MTLKRLAAKITLKIAHLITLPDEKSGNMLFRTLKTGFVEKKGQLGHLSVFAGVLFVHQPGANHAPRASVTQVNHSVHTLSTFLRIRPDPSMQIF